MIIVSIAKLTQITCESYRIKFLILSIRGLYFLYFRRFNAIDSTNKICWRLDSNRGPLALEVSALPTEPTTTALL